ncbi:SDR family NAD(P)-dependent oxidoreductase [Algoriphagus sp. CAU 1675]|uniref:SDR family NAD(P)-dependent oxidoreductase n=1 Tax=Algoriphagus sp. CAU 1675 TaxID=3032597 RepID=UPI0023DB3797|nr:SDR family NAD(P)-dependent oxidoreductase [Algoriphagus sp. CAU 1675]MDF2159247.1 SDR family NAD(P)-dependent oxidoreductase [Algoriphagus sp. CAU 1675]
MKKSLLILTGHSKGLGKATLDQYLKKPGFQVIAISRTNLENSAENLTQLDLDLSELDVLENNLRTIFPQEDFEEVVLINNAGWIGEIKPIGELHPAELRKQINLNLLAPMYLTNAFIKAYKTTAGKKVVCNISSGAASRPVSGWGGYCSTKAALAMFTMVAAKESSSPNFKFYSLAPGVVDTDMQQNIREASKEDFPELDKFQKYKSNGDLSKAQDVAAKIEFMLSHVEKFPEVIQDVRNFEVA